MVAVVLQGCPCTCPLKTGATVKDGDVRDRAGRCGRGHTKEGVQAPRRLQCEMGWVGMALATHWQLRRWLVISSCGFLGVGWAGITVLA